MNITLKKITVRELTAGYIDHEEDGVKAIPVNWTSGLLIRGNSSMMTNRELLS